MISVSMLTGSPGFSDPRFVIFTVWGMMAIDSEAHYFYLVHFVLWLIAFTAIGAVWYWDRRSVPRWALAA